MSVLVDERGDPLAFLHSANGLPQRLSGKESTCKAGDVGSISRLGSPLVEVMAIHSSILIGKIPWTEEPGGLWCMGLQRVGHY